MVIWIGIVVHAEGSVYMATVGNFLEGLADKLCWSLETLPHVGTYVHSMPYRKFISKMCKTASKKKLNLLKYLWRRNDFLFHQEWWHQTQFLHIGLAEQVRNLHLSLQKRCLCHINSNVIWMYTSLYVCGCTGAFVFTVLSWLKLKKNPPFSAASWGL